MLSYSNLLYILYSINNLVEFFENLFVIGKSCMYFLEKIKYYIYIYVLIVIIYL